MNIKRTRKKDLQVIRMLFGPFDKEYLDKHELKNISEKAIADKVQISQSTVNLILSEHQRELLKKPSDQFYFESILNYKTLQEL